MRKTILFVLQLVCVTMLAQTGKVHILSVNDMHSAIERFPQFAVIVDSLRQAHPDLLLLSAGDNRTGNPINDIDPVPSRPMVSLMNKVGFNFSTIGNHEFDGDISGLRSMVNNSSCRYLCANAIVPDTMLLHMQPFSVVQTQGIRVGILGLIQTNEFTGIPDSHPKNVAGIKFQPVIDCAKEYSWLRDACHVLIYLTHNGYEADLQLAQAMPQADVIVGGHSHTKLDPCKMENNVMITQTERWLKYATFITIDVKDGKVVSRDAKLIDVANYPRKDQQVQAMVDEFSNNPFLKRVLTTAEAFTEKEQLGNLMADAQREELKADIAVQNSGGVRYDTKPQGNFTVDDVYRLDPFGNEMYEVELTGEEVVRMLAAVCVADGYGPGFVSGIKYTIHLGKDNRDVKGVKVFTEDGKKFDLKRKYRVVMNSYIAEVADYKKADEGKHVYATSADIIMRYLEKHPNINYQGDKRATIIMDRKYSR